MDTLINGGEEWESGSGEEWERGAMIAGAKSKNHLIKGGGLTDQLYECICYKLIFFFFLRYGEFG